MDLTQGDITTRAILSDISYSLFTKNNKDQHHLITNGDVSQLSNTFFDPTKLTIFISHGWNNNNQSAVNSNLKAAILDKYDVNLFITDWRGPANSNYLTARYAVTSVGQFQVSIPYFHLKHAGADIKSCALDAHAQSCNCTID